MAGSEARDEIQNWCCQSGVGAGGQYTHGNPPPTLFCLSNSNEIAQGLISISSQALFVLPYKVMIILVSNKGHVKISVHSTESDFGRSLFHVRRAAPAVITSCQTRGSDWINSSGFYWALTPQTPLHYPMAGESRGGERKSLVLPCNLPLPFPQHAVCGGGWRRQGRMKASS